MDYVGEFQTDSGLLLLPWETSGVDDRGCGCGEKDNCVLECDPLSRWEPNELRELLKKFCNTVGLPILKHEAQCLALFRLFEQECLKVIDDGVLKQPANSGARGLRELKGLISNVNYDGVSSRSRSRASSTVVEVVDSFK